MSCLTPCVGWPAMGSRSRRRSRERDVRADLSVREVLYAAAGASGGPSDAGYRALLARLALLPAVEVEVGLALHEALRRARALNWDDAAIHHQAERRLGTGHAALVG